MGISQERQGLSEVPFSHSVLLPRLAALCRTSQAKR